MALADGSLRSLLARLSHIDVLVIDDWVMAPLSEFEMPASLRSEGIRVRPGMSFGFPSESAFGFAGILTKGWESLTSQTGLDAARILKATPAQLSAA